MSPLLRLTLILHTSQRQILKTPHFHLCQAPTLTPLLTQMTMGLMECQCLLMWTHLTRTLTGCPCPVVVVVEELLIIKAHKKVQEMQMQSEQLD